jgi:hypothetical protein
MPAISSRHSLSSFTRSLHERGTKYLPLSRPCPRFATEPRGAPIYSTAEGGEPRAGPGLRPLGLLRRVPPQHGGALGRVGHPRPQPLASASPCRGPDQTRERLSGRERGTYGPVKTGSCTLTRAISLPRNTDVSQHTSRTDSQFPTGAKRRLMVVVAPRVSGLPDAAAWVVSPRPADSLLTPRAI